MAEQLIFDLPVRAALGHGDFFVSDGNAAAVSAIAEWQNWSAGKLVLCGPCGAGKTHLAHVWAAQSEAQIIEAPDILAESVAEIVARSPRIAVEDVDRIAGDEPREQALFHLHNLALVEGGRLLLTGQDAPTNWPLTLPDLKSRILGAALVRLSAPDDGLMAMVLVKLFADRQLEISPPVIQYLVGHMERSFDAAGRIVTALDETALTEGRAISRKLAARVLDKISRKEL